MAFTLSTRAPSFSRRLLYIDILRRSHSLGQKSIQDISRKEILKYEEKIIQMEGAKRTDCTWKDNSGKRSYLFTAQILGSAHGHPGENYEMDR